MKIKINKLNDQLIMPTRGHYNDAGIDCYALEDITLKCLEPQHLMQQENGYLIGEKSVCQSYPTMISLGFGIELPDGYMAVLKPRSSMNSKGIITQIGTIDSGYHGEIKAVLINLTGSDYQIKRGDRICQLVIEPVIYADFVETLEEKEARGNGGFGSTGK